MTLGKIPLSGSLDLHQNKKYIKKKKSKQLANLTLNT